MSYVNDNTSLLAIKEKLDQCKVEYGALEGVECSTHVATLRQYFNEVRALVMNSVAISDQDPEDWLQEVHCMECPPTGGGGEG
jgi:hypothetical protein